MQNKAKQYLQNQIMTASKEQLLIMLFDGAIRFSTQAKELMNDGNIEESCQLLIKAQRIMIELISALNKDLIGEDLYNNLMRLYNFIYFRLINANLKKDPILVDEALHILGSIRETWIEAIEKNQLENFPEVALGVQSEKERNNVNFHG